MTDRGHLTICELESDCWVLLQPIDLWVYQRGDCWTVGDLGPFIFAADGDSFEAARDAFCRKLIDEAERAERRGETFDDYIRRVNKSNAASGQNWQNTATDE
jgi:hypothetical protein